MYCMHCLSIMGVCLFGFYIERCQNCGAMCLLCTNSVSKNVFSVYPYLTPADVLVQTLLVTILISILYVSQNKYVKECSRSIQFKSTVVDSIFVNVQFSIICSV